jgi:hypothetical protein
MAGRRKSSTGQWKKTARLGLGALDVLGLQTLVAGNDVERDRFAFVQRFEASPQDGCVMNKHILPRLLGDEAEPFFVIEPLYFATCHILSPDNRAPSSGEQPTASASMRNQVLFSG